MPRSRSSALLALAFALPACNKTPVIAGESPRANPPATADIPRASLQALPLIDHARSVFVSGQLVCVTLADGKITCLRQGGSFGHLDAAGSLSRKADSIGPCAVRASGAIVCWEGADSFSGQPESTPSLPPVDIALLGGTTGIARLRSGDVVAFTTSSPTQVSAPLPGWNGLQQLVGDDESGFCARLAPNDVRCVRANKVMSLARGSELQVQPSATVPIDDVLDIASSAGVFWALHRSGDVSTWKLDDKTSRSTPVEKVGRVPQAVQITAGRGFACVRLASGDVACWGDNSHGQLATNDLEPRKTPTNVEGLHDAVFLDAGPSTACAVRRSGKVVCWGSGVFDAKVPAAN